ncbi:lectin-like domain-containing protein [Sinosporangium siamense]|uniref:DUF11 domain-containing protein n=1 Tax=Sinosporangium siamense TaxID=1367973 RepID=A0A919RDT8_9ACTN|nr:hypothetical protein [Sinosporangium siamense]GII91778.1 hypothetical protein Ssi02_20090 [Sinosporangium siamense]
MKIGRARAVTAPRPGLTAVATAVSLGFFALTAPPASAAELLDEGFRVDSTPSGVWTSSSVQGGDAPCLTAASAPPTASLGACAEGATDPVGQGVLRLTDDSAQAAGAILLNRPIPARRGVVIEFDLYMWGGRPYADSLGPRGGDGVSFYIVDGAASTAQAGEPGGALGYKGLRGAVVGIGFDQFGNFSNPRWAGKGGPGVKPNSVVIRGSESTGYGYVDGKALTRPLDDATGRDAAKRHVLIALSPENLLSVKIRHREGEPYQDLFTGVDLDALPNQNPLPDTIKVGFAASTGIAAANHALSDLKIRTLDADLGLAVGDDGPWQAGGTGAYTLTASAKPQAGVVDAPTKLTFETSAGVTPTAASGQGWTCSIAQREVTCDTTAVLRPGQSFPQVEVKVAIDRGTASMVTASGAVTSGNADADPADNTVDRTTGVTAAAGPPPNLGLTVAGDTTLAPGGSGTITVTTANAAGTGPATGTVTGVFTVTPPIEITGVTGAGWTCGTADRQVICTRTDRLDGGDSHPPIGISVRVPNVTGGPAAYQATVTTPGDGNPGDNTTTGFIRLPVIDPPPTGTLSIRVVSTPKPYVPGRPYSYSVTVRNPGATAVSGATLMIDWPSPWDRIRWTCTSSGGICPVPAGVGDVTKVIGLSSGGTMTFTVVCVMPPGIIETYTATASITAPGTTCTTARPCTGADTNSPA